MVVYPWTPCLSEGFLVVGFACMSYMTMEAEIDHGRIIPKEPEKLPATGRALITVLEPAPHQPDWNKVMSLLGTMKQKIDGLTLERGARREWEDRERSHWGEG